MLKKNLLVLASLPVLIILTGFYLYQNQPKVLALKPLETSTKEQKNAQTQASISSILKISSKVKSNTFISANNLLVTQKGNDLLVLVNKKISLPSDFVPENLVSLDGVVSTFKHEVLRADALSSLKNLLADSQNQGINLSVASAYRSYSDQQITFNGWVASAGLSAAESFSARAGHSQHQLGTAIDFGNTKGPSFSGDFGKSAEGVWLSQNAYKYGFVISYPQGQEKVTGYSYEPWHYRFIGIDNAKKMVDSGLILETYLAKYGTW